MNRARRLQVVEDAADEAWLQDEAQRAGVPLHEARLALATLDATFARHQVGEGAMLAAETIVAVIREFAVAVAPDEDPALFVAEVMECLELDAPQKAGTTPDRRPMHRLSDRARRLASGEQGRLAL